MSLRVPRIALPFLLWLGLLAMVFPSAQANDSLRFSSVWVVVDNDNFKLVDKTDKFYSSGLYLGIATNYHQRFRAVGIPTRQSLFQRSRYKLTFSHQIYTPTDIERPESLRLDYPFSSLFLLGFSAETESDEWSYAIGGRGPVAMGGQAQTFLHGMFGYPMPQGWDHQLPNELVYQLGWKHRAEWLFWDQWTLQGNHMIQVGNVRTSGVAGIDIEGSWHGFSLLFQALGEAVLYNGQIHYGWVPENPRLHPLVGHLRLNATLRLGDVQLRFGQWFISSELRTREAHGWGHFTVFWDL